MEERPMKVILLAVALAASTAFGAYAAAAGTQLSQAECDSLWNQANPSGAATINQSQAQPYVTDFKSADPDNDGTLSQNEFSAACKAGLVKSSSSTGAASGDTGNKMAPAEKMTPAPASKMPPKGY
jgi:Ca2+-binding EF-hand superfamily protein